MSKKQPASTATITAPAVVQELVAKFAEQQEDYRRGDCNETQLRRDYLDPFFAAMGWDVDNRKGYAEAYRARLPQVKTDHERTALQRQIAATDREIDQLVYQLYGLTAEEIAMVEEGTAK